MVTDEERRYVARKLRLGGGPSLVKLMAYLHCGGNELFGRLADLIEPSGHECVPGECPLNVCHDNDRIDRDELLEEVKELERCAGYFGLDFDEDEPLRDRLKEASEDFAGSADRIRKALGVES